MKRLFHRFLVPALFALFTSALPADEGKAILAHYMPWYTADAEAGRWGWHWTMDRFDPNRVRWDGKRDVASHDYPLIGLYDSSDRAVIECQLQQMKLAGIDGVIIDWYGTDDVNDYAAIHESTKQLIEVVEKAGLQFAICYEDRSIEQAIKRGKLKEEDAVKRAAETLQGVADEWFASKAYLKVDERPVLLVFGPIYFSEEQWEEVVAPLDGEATIHALPHLSDRPGVDAPFAWPPVTGGKSVSSDEWKKSLRETYETEGEVAPIPVVFPGFRDIYEKAGLHESYGFISDRDGQTFRDTLELAAEQESPFIQVATWNDYGEGTVIEPTTNLGYRYLVELQEHDGAGADPSDLLLPAELLQLRRRIGDDPDAAEGLNEISERLFEGKCDDARGLLAEWKKREATLPAWFENGPNLREPGYRLHRDILYRGDEKIDEYAKLRCRLDVYSPADGKNLPVVIWFHGGGISKGNRSVPLPLRNQGVIVVTANYRLSPNVEVPAYLEDAAAAVAWTVRHIERYGGSSERIFISGHSAGGYLASMVGLDPRYLVAHGIDTNQVAGLIPFSGHTITHFTIRKERGIDLKKAIVDDYAPLYHVRKDTPPILLITGDREKEIYGRYEETAYFWRMMKEAGHPDVGLAELEGFDHGGMPEPAFPLLLDFVRERSKP